MTKKQRISKRSLLLYSQLLFNGFKKEPLALNWEQSYYGIELTKTFSVFIHKRKARFSVEDAESYYNDNLAFIVPVTKITDKSLALILEVTNAKKNK